MNMAWDELGKGIDDRDDGFVKVLVGHACGAPKSACASHVTAVGCRAGAIGDHWGESLL